MKPFPLIPIVAGGLMVASGLGYAQSAAKPPVINALEGKGLTIVQEFNVGGGMRAFAGVAGDRPLAVYVTADGKAIVGTRLGTNGEPIDDVTLQKLVAKPMSDQIWAQLESASWILDGKADAPRVIYTFSDPNCPYCNRFWETARPWVIAGKVQLRHILVGVISASSPAKAAAILGAQDRSAALLKNETNFAKGGITPAKDIPHSIQQTLEKNQILMASLGFQGTPGIVTRDSNGIVKKYSGLPQQSISEVLGPR
ncbi:MAG: thiol:disulfide interchange protein DsbG [Rhodocyclaceae bacterium]|nr:thiol:disulfide interchange protein DsbG [Rhodocyclaceae bacterium]